MLPCAHCGEPVEDGDMVSMIGVHPGHSLHHDCGLRMAAGSLGHQLGLCGCGGSPAILGDPPGLSDREAARCAAAYFREHNPDPRS